MSRPRKWCETHNRQHKGQRCVECYAVERAASKATHTKTCATCGHAMARGTQGKHCVRCFWDAKKAPEHAARIVHEEARVAPSIPPVPYLTGSAMLCADVHAPWHDPHAVLDMCDTAVLLKIKRLIIAGDVIHADSISKYVGVAPSIPVTKELESLGRLLAALEEVFDEIIVIPGNHDQRVEKMIASMKDTKDGRRGLELIAKLLGVNDPDDAEDISLRYMRHFFQSNKVTWHALPDLVLNNTWRIQHPGSVSRIAPQNERAMVRKHRQSVIQGHSHLFGIGFDESAQDIAFNIGHLAKDSKWRYVRERPGTFPKSVQGYAVIYQTEDSPCGRLIPIAIHDRWFRMRDLAVMFGASL